MDQIIEYNNVYKALHIDGLYVQWLGKKRRLYSLYHINYNLLSGNYVKYNGRFVRTT